MSLKIKTFLGVFWVGGYYISTQLLTFTVSIILAHLLAPEDFGLIAMAMLIISNLVIFQNLGLNTALIRWSQTNDKINSTAFYLITLTSLCLVIGGWVIAPYTAVFFNNSQLTLILRWLVITILLDALGIIPATLLDKELEFRKQLWPNTIPLFIYGFIAVLLAQLGVGVWSIVWGRIAQSALRTTLWWVIAPSRLQFTFDIVIARKLLSYGKDITLTSLLIFVFLSVDNLVVGKILGERALGLYSTAFGLSNLPAILVTSVFGKVLLSAFSKLQPDLPTMGRAYLKAIGLIFSITLPIAICFYSLSEELVFVLYPTQWFDMIAMIKIFSLYGLFRSLGAVTGPVYMASGKQTLMLKIVTIQVLLLSILIYPITIRYNILGTAWLVTLIMIVIIVIHLIVIGQVINVTLKEYFKLLTPPIIAGIIMILVFGIMKNLINLSIYRLIILSGSAVIVYSITLYLMAKDQIFKELLELYPAIFPGSKR